MTMKFELNEIESKRAKEFLEKHRHPDINKGAIGGHIYFCFTPTSVGNACSIRCKICGKEENITDYTSW